MVRGGKAFDKTVDQISNDDEKVTKVNLSGRSISDQGVIRLAKGLAWNSHVTSLDLSKNEVGPDGAMALASALEQNMTVTTLKLNKNSLGNKGAIALSKSLRENLTITSLELKDNGIGNEGAIALLDAISLHQTILSLDLSKNKDIDKALLMKIGQCTKESKAILEDEVICFSHHGDNGDEDGSDYYDDDDDDNDGVGSVTNEILPLMGSFVLPVAPPQDRDGNGHNKRAASSDGHSSYYRSDVESDPSLPGTIPGISSDRGGDDSNHEDTDGDDSGGDSSGNNSNDSVENANYAMGAAALPNPYNKSQSADNIHDVAQLLPFKHWVGLVGKHFINTDESEENSSSLSSETSYLGTLNMDGDSTTDKGEEHKVEKEQVYIDHMENVTTLAEDPNGFEPSCIASSHATPIHQTKHCRCFPLSKIAVSLVVIAVLIAVIFAIVLATQPELDNETNKSTGVVDLDTSGPSSSPSVSLPSLHPSFVPALNPPTASTSPTTQSTTYSTISFSEYSLQQTGQSLPGDAPYDQFGYSTSISHDGSILAVGSPYHDSTLSLSNSGLVQIYKLRDGILRSSNKKWELAGEISGHNYYGFFGHSVSLSGDGTRIAVSEPGSDGLTGRVVVYYYDSGDSTWKQLGQNITGSESGDLFGYSVALSGNGSRVGVGAPSHQSRSGQIQIYEFDDDGRWTMIGSPIEGKSTEELGTAISLSNDGSILVAGAPASQEGGNVKIYKSPDQTSINDETGEYTTNEWDIIGNLTSPAMGAKYSDNFGSSVSLSSDGSRIAIGSPMYANKKGLVSTYEFFENLSTWSPMGDALVGTTSSYFGKSVALSPDGEYLAAGFPGDTRNGIDSGKIQIFSWNGTEWVGSLPELSGNAKDEFGFSVSLSQNAGYVAVGAPVRGGEYDGSRGYVRSFSLGMRTNSKY